MAMFEGRRLRVVTTAGDVFEGTVHSLDVNNSKISLMKVCLVPSGKKLTGLLHFYGPELKELDDISELETVQAEQKKNKSHPPQDDDSCTEDEESNAQTAQTTEYIYLRRTGTRFEQAIFQIRSQRLIGIASEAESLGRRSKLSLLQICCANQVYIFDVVSLGPVFFSQGLADILESPAIVKVIHDSRWTSDQLYHQYSIKLTNVFDTQAADVLIGMRRQNGELPHKLSSLTQCLLEYLDMSVEALYPQLLHDQAKMMNETSMWMKRPLSSKLLSQAAFNVRHLPDLRVKTLDHLLAEFTASVDVFLNCIRDMSDMNRGKANVSSSVVPRQLKRLVYGDLPSTNLPVTNHSAVSTGFDPIKTEAPPAVATTEKLHPTSSHAPNESTVKPQSNDQPPSTSSEPHPSTSNSEQFCTPKMAVPKDRTTNVSKPRFTNGHTQYSEKESPRRGVPGERRAMTKEYTTVVFSPSADGRSVVKLGQGVAEPKVAVPSTENENTEGSFDTSWGFKKSEGAVGRLAEDVVTLSLHGEGRSDSDGGAGCGKDDVEETSDMVCEEEAQKESSSSDDEKYTDYDDDDEDECKEQDDLLDKASMNHNPVLTSQTEQAKHLSLSPHQRLRTLTKKMSASSKNLPPNYLGRRGIATHETENGDKSGSRLYSRVLSDAGLTKKLNITSEAQFPGLDSETGDKSKKMHSPARDEGRNSEGAIPKRPTLHTLYPREPVTVTELSTTPMTRPSVGRGRATTLACYEDMRRNIHRPLELHINSPANGDGRYDFPSQEELARVPKMPPQRASSYPMVPGAL